MEQQNSTLLTEVKIEPDDAEYPSLQTSWMTDHHEQDVKKETTFSYDHNDSSDQLEAGGVTVKFEVEEGTKGDESQDEKHIYEKRQEMARHYPFFNPQPSTSTSSVDGRHSGLYAEGPERKSDGKNVEMIRAGSKYPCEICNKTFRKSSDLSKHKLIHSGEKPHVCDVCSKGFSEAGNLNKHKLIHTGQKPYECDVCGKGFRSSRNLKEHQVIHTGQSPHTCDVCNKVFAEARKLERHRMTHTGQKSFACDVCNKMFAEASSLKQHKLTHTVTSKKPHVCDVCNKAYAWANSLRHHMLTHTVRDLSTSQESPSQAEQSSVVVRPVDAECPSLQTSWMVENHIQGISNNCLRAQQKPILSRTDYF